MEEYIYNAHLEQRMKKSWESEHKLKVFLLSGDLKGLVTEFSSENGFRAAMDCQDNRIAFWRRYGGGFSGRLSDFLKKRCRPLIEIMVPEAYREGYYAFADRLTEFPYTEGLGRRTIRSSNLGNAFPGAIAMLSTYRRFGQLGISVVDYLRDNIPEEYRAVRCMLPCMDAIIAAGIDAGNAELIDCIREAILSENNHVAVSVEMIRGIVQSRNTELHTLLGKLLLAARLQEGLRQAICENADCGTVDAFLEILRVIRENDLIRFSSVKRAVAVWCGVFGEDAQRISPKVLDALSRAAVDAEAARRMTYDTDSVELVLGLWGMAFRSVEEAAVRMQEMAGGKVRQQVLAASYYAGMLQDPRLCGTIFRSGRGDGTDLEAAAIFLHCCMPDVSHRMFHAVQSEKTRVSNRRTELLELFPGEAEARECFAWLNTVYDTMKGNKKEFSPLLFPWYGVTMIRGELVGRMAYIAYLLQDSDLIDRVCPLLASITRASNVGIRSWYVNLLLSHPGTAIQRQTLLEAICDKEGEAREEAYHAIETLKLTDGEYTWLEGCLRYKNDDIRSNVVQLLQKRDTPSKSVARLLSEENELLRLGGLELAKRTVEACPEKQPEYSRLVKTCLADRQLTQREQLQVDAFLEKDGEAADAPGYGLYHPDCLPELPKITGNPDVIRRYFSCTRKELDALLAKIDAFLEENGHREYKDFSGQTRLLKNELWAVTMQDGGKFHERYPFPELWRELYETIVKTPQTFWNLFVATRLYTTRNYRKLEEELLGDCAKRQIEFRPQGKMLPRAAYYRDLFDLLKSMYGFRLPWEVVREICLAMVAYPNGWGTVTTYGYSRILSVSHDSVLGELIAQLQTEDENFRESFWLLYRMDEAYPLDRESDSRSFYGKNGLNQLTILHYVKAYTLGMISRDLLYYAAFQIVGVQISLNQLSCLMTGKEIRKGLLPFLGFGHSGMPEQEHPVWKAGMQLYRDMVDVILNVELKRGEVKTEFSSAVSQIMRVEGVRRLEQLLQALGNDPLDRNAYYGQLYGYGSSGRKACLSHLLKVSQPEEGDTQEAFAQAMNRLKLTPSRLTEIAMYAPQWMPWLETYLQYPGFTSGCYYFMAHMNEQFDERKAAKIARFTPLSAEELNDGCFDTAWFYDVYGQLGEERFSLLYNAAKYIADGSKHSRARKYADAALGKVTLPQLEAAICDKRNKDLLMSYGLVPLESEQDILRRYQFLQQFLKESKQFGAQRRASESKCVGIALKNLATTAGYSDALRLTLAMETELVSANAAFFAQTEIDGYICQVTVDEDGRAELTVSKNGKLLKAPPAAIRKNAAFTARKDFVKQLRNQYSRCRAMLESSMENREEYTLKELHQLCGSPVTAGILHKLLFTAEGKSFRLRDIVLPEETKVRIAHPYDLYSEGSWTQWQKVFFAEQVIQPFRQVFRELYPALREEQDASRTALFSGHQLQPQKTLGVLKSRGWSADYDSGLQKIYYRDNLAVQLYALADWFSPADVEPPTLEYVAFFNRKTGEPVPIREVPPIVYSETMRDVDLAVSVAHAGGVDPEASHSTVEMRAVIVQYNAELFGLANVTVSGTHAMIRGKLGDYTVHLGSGVIHQDGLQIHVLPVHSQTRGKFFLPFVDEDPKTAEIISKVLLFAKDDKIKDPYILDQLRR